MTQTTFIDSVYIVAEAAKPYMHIQNEETYQEALHNISVLMELAGDDSGDLIHSIITALAQSVEIFENREEDVRKFLTDAVEGPADVATLRLLMSQHGLTGSDLPEIGDKTLVSKILNGDRKLTKQHIGKLSQRFGISPALFFEPVDS